MTRIILDVPAEKMRSFIQLIMKLGLDKHSISSSDHEIAPHHAKTYKQRDRRRSHLMKNFPAKFSKFLLFDWEFFSNELEFE